jgi:hypothetical protein
VELPHNAAQRLTCRRHRRARTILPTYFSTHPNSTIIGVKEGPSMEELKEALREELHPLFAVSAEVAARLRSNDPASASIYVCSSGPSSALGFAVNNSGLIVCPSSIGTVVEATDLLNGEHQDAEPVERRRMLQAVSISSPTRGLVPAYVSQPGFADELFAWDDKGMQIQLTVDSIHLTAKVGDESDGFLITDGFMARFEPGPGLIGGPVTTATGEVLGIAVGMSPNGFLFVQPWSGLGRCIDMDVAPLPQPRE